MVSRQHARGPKAARGTPCKHALPDIVALLSEQTSLREGKAVGDIWQLQPPHAQRAGPKHPRHFRPFGQASTVAAHNVSSESLFVCLFVCFAGGV